MARHALAAAVLVLALTGCAGSDAAACPAPTPLTEQASGQVPDDLDLTEFGTLVRFETVEALVSYRVEGEGSVQDLYVPVTRLLEDGGWDLVGSENEGVDAEVYFARGTTETGALLLSELDCPGTVAIEVTVNSPAAAG